MRLQDMTIEDLKYEYDIGRYDIINFNNSLGMTKNELISHVDKIEQEIFLREQEQYLKRMYNDK